MSRSHRLWRRTVVRLLGGFHERGRYFLCIHDDGVCGGTDRVTRFDWRFVPPEIIRCAAMRFVPPPPEV
jgi:hypothetical protein